MSDNDGDVLAKVLAETPWRSILIPLILALLVIAASIALTVRG